MSTSDMELTLDMYMVMPTSTGLPEYTRKHTLRCTVKAAFHDVHTDSFADIFARIIARMSVSVSMSVSWNAGLSRLVVNSIHQQT